MCHSHSQWLREVCKDLSIQATNITLLQSLKIQRKRVRFIAKKPPLFIFLLSLILNERCLLLNSHTYAIISGPSCKAQGMSLLSTIFHETRKRPEMEHFLYKIGSISGRVWPRAGTTETCAARGPAVGREKTLAHRDGIFRNTWFKFSLIFFRVICSDEVNTHHVPALLVIKMAGHRSDTWWVFLG